MRKLLLTTAFALPLGYTAAFAQDATAPATDPAAGAATTETAPMAETETDAAETAAAASAAEKVEQQQAANEWRIDWITGTTVTSPNGEDIGAISDLIVDGDTGEMKAAIVGVGGFLGIGEKQIALPWGDLTINSDAQEITSDLTTEEAEAAPEYVFREQEQPAGANMTDPATGATTQPAADPMASGGMGGTAPAAGTATAPAGTTAMEGEAPESGNMETQTMPAETDSTGAAATGADTPGGATTGMGSTDTTTGAGATGAAATGAEPMETEAEPMGTEAETSAETETEAETPAPAN